MANIAALLKAEITRLSKKVIRDHLDPLHKSHAAHKRQLSELRTQFKAMELQLKSLQQHHAATEKSSATAPKGRTPRFSPKGLASSRKRLGISAKECGLLLKVSQQTIYNWEHRVTSPGTEQRVAIAALGKTGKKEVASRLKAFVPA